jgi:hypothetical protein
MIVQRRGALSGAPLLSIARAGCEVCERPVGGAARASRTKSEISCIQGTFVCFDLDPSSLSLRRVKAQALRGNTQIFPSYRGSFERKPSLRPNNPRLEARLSLCRFRSSGHSQYPFMQSRKIASPFFSYCPGTALSVRDAVSRLSASPRYVVGIAKATPLLRADFRLLRRRIIPQSKCKTACCESDSRFQFQLMSEGPHVERRTSCVLYIPRIPRDARSIQHAWQGFQPMHPTKEGACLPLCWILPAHCAGGRV